MKLVLYFSTSGANYMIFAIGDEERVQYIDLAVYDENGLKVGTYNNDGSVALATLASDKSQMYKISVNGYKMAAYDGFYAICIGRKD